VRGGTDELHNPQVCRLLWAQTQVVSYWLAAQTLVIIYWLSLAQHQASALSRLSLAVNSERTVKMNFTLIEEAVSQKLSSYRSSCYSVVSAVFRIRIDPLDPDPH
jgi:hypothetical protein